MERTKYLIKTIAFFYFLSLNIISIGQEIPYIYKNEWKNVGLDTTQITFKPKQVYNVLETEPKLTADGKTDNAPLLQSLINNTNRYPSPCVFYFPEGTYYFSRDIMLKSGRIIRGESAKKTKFISHTGNTVFDIYQFNGRRIDTIISKIPKGRSFVIVKNPKLFKNKGFVEFYRENDSIIVPKKWDRNWSKQLVGMINQIDKISVDTLFLHTPSHIDFNRNNKGKILIKPIEMISNVGFENFSIKSTNPKMKGHVFLFINAANCWITGVESEYTMKYHVALETSSNISVNNCYFHKSYNYGGGGKGYGIECAHHTTNCLIENNVLDSLRHSMMVHLGANGNVYAYNFSIHPILNNGKEGLVDISVHGHYAFANLFEGNIVEKIGISDYWGNAGPYNTFFKNQIRKVFYIANADNTIAVGNRLLSEKNIKVNNTSKNVFLASNIINNEVKNPLANIPKSLYLDDKPTFFNKKQWETFDNKNKTKYTIPAKKRYYSDNKIADYSKKKKGFFKRIWTWIKNIF